MDASPDSARFDRGYVRAAAARPIAREPGGVRVAGISTTVMDPNNPNVLYAGFWQVYRTPWTLQSGGAGSG